MSMYANRKNITLINELRSFYGDRITQTNSRRNGCFVETVRLYPSPTNRGRPARAIWTVTDAGELEARAAETRTAANQSSL